MLWLMAPSYRKQVFPPDEDNQSSNPVVPSGEMDVKHRQIPSPGADLPGKWIAQEDELL